MFPTSETDATVTLECANRHRATAPLPAERATRTLIDNWIAKKGAQLHAQHERWESEEDEMAETRLVRRGDRRRETTQTPGMTREEAVRTEGLWAGVAHTAGNTFSGWHHHGAYESVIHVLRGHLRLEFGPRGRIVLEAEPGDTLYVAPGEVHREGNPGSESSEIVVVRAGQGDIVVNVDGPRDQR
jgi:uncharacterized RmlC-like cupin family protein